MKFNAGKRVLLFFYWLFSVLAIACFATHIIQPDLVEDVYDRLTAPLSNQQITIIGIALLAIYVILAIAALCVILKRRKRSDRGFIIVDSSETGRVRISVPAVEMMVRESVDNVEGITDMKIRIDNLEDAIGINVKASIVNGSHVPTVTMNMQHAIRQYVETNCGVAVRNVSISINNVIDGADAPKAKKRGRRESNAMPVAPVTPVEKKAEPEPIAAPAIEPTFTEPVKSEPVETYGATAAPKSFEAPAAAADEEEEKIDPARMGAMAFARDFQAAMADAEAPQSDFGYEEAPGSEEDV